MKFGKVIQKLGEELPDTQFLKYKQLKKMLKQVKKNEEAGDLDSERPETSEGVASQRGEDSVTQDAAASDGTSLSPEETRFIKALNEELSKLNGYFKDREGKVVVRLQGLENELRQVEKGKSRTELGSLKAAFIDFHGEIVMLLHWGLLNYAAVNKILKKHDKLTGVSLRGPYLDAVYRQPFLCTEPLARLAERVAHIVEQFSGIREQPAQRRQAKEPCSASGTDGTPAVDERVRMAQIALGMWEDLRHNASTPSTVLASKIDAEGSRGEEGPQKNLDFERKHDGRLGLGSGDDEGEPGLLRKAISDGQISEGPASWSI
ncbi:hypothetical protein BSKO_01835 [Bryopsis sp. KO-2023]|nr:hypothetical protein BSKO_01835 [Bryopsis sp. KO-2023]